MPWELTLDEERELIERARGGDGEAFGRIYDTFAESLYRTVIFPRVRDEKSAEEILQETFMLAVEKIRGFEFRDRSIFFWLRMIAINKTHEWVSQSVRHATVDDAVFDFHHDDTYQPENQVVLEDYTAALRSRILEVLEEMNERYRTALRMRLMEKKPREDCAAALSVSIETFDVLFFRACKSFKKIYMGKYGEMEYTDAG